MKQSTLILTLSLTIKEIICSSLNYGFVLEGTYKFHNYYDFVLMEPYKLLSTVKILNKLYYPDKLCTIVIQDVPTNKNSSIP